MELADFLADEAGGDVAGNRGSGGHNATVNKFWVRDEVEVVQETKPIATL